MDNIYIVVSDVCEEDGCVRHLRTEVEDVYFKTKEDAIKLIDQIIGDITDALIDNGAEADEIEHESFNKESQYLYNFDNKYHFYVKELKFNS